MALSGVASSGGLGDGMVTSNGGGDRAPEDGVTEDRGIPGRREEPAAEEVEGQLVANGPKVCGGGSAMIDQGGADGMREPGRATRLRVSGGAEGERSQGEVQQVGRRKMEQRGQRQSCRILWNRRCYWLHDMWLNVLVGHPQRGRRAADI